MFGNWTFAKKIIAGYGIGAVVLLIVVAVAYRSTVSLIDNNDAVTHTYQVRENLYQLLADLINVETGARGYAITGSDDFLQPYQAAVGRTQPEVATIRKLTADNPAQQRRLTALQPLITKQLDISKQTIDLRKSGGLDAAAKLVGSGQGKAVMDQIRTIVGEAAQEEADLLATRRNEASDSARWTIALILGGGAIGIVLNVLTAWLITSSVSKQISSAVGHVQSSSTELQAAATQQAAGSREQATAMSEIRTTITELLATSRQIADSAQRVAQIAEQTAGGARSGQGAVDLAQGAIAGICRQVDQVVAYMLELGKKSQQIGAVLEIVSELAEQTNILAINATIEAIGAGDSGKRFAVVAEEIRKLADRVGGSAKEIRGLIDDVRSAVNTTVMATETGSKAVNSGSQQFDAVAAGFRRIADLVNTTTDAAREIELSTKQQATAVEQVNLAIGNAAQASREAEASAGQTLQTASDLAHLSTDLARIVRPERLAA